MRDPNSVGQDVVYDALDRAGLTTDTAGATTKSTYDKAGNRVATIDGKTKSTTYDFDARGRQKSQKDRNNGTTSFAYVATGQLQSLTDAETQTTSYTYDDAGGKLGTQCSLNITTELEFITLIWGVSRPESSFWAILLRRRRLAVSDPLPTT